MVSYPGRTADTRRIRRLKSPEFLEVEASAEGTPLRVRLRGTWQDVDLVRRPWRVEQYWWREEAVSRLYFRIVLPDGLPLTIYHDLTSGMWLRQEYR